MTTRGAAVGLLCVLATAGCGTDDKDGCTAACQKAVECGEKVDPFENCVASCSQDPGNEAMAACWAAIPGCDEKFGPCADIQTTCTQAVKKINECMAANGATKSMSFNGWCNDQAMTLTASGPKKIPFLTWSKTYLACTIDPQTCRCPGQTWWEDW